MKDSKEIGLALGACLAGSRPVKGLGHCSGMLRRRMIGDKIRDEEREPAHTGAWMPLQRF